MPELRIPPLPSGEVSTTDPATVEAFRAAFGPAASHLVPAHDLARFLRTAGRKHWASILDQEEEASVVRVGFTD